jgi:hypothetical protein
MTTERDRILARTTAEARAAYKTTRIDLDAFLAAGNDRAAQWRQWDVTAKTDAVIQQLGRAGRDWDIALVAAWIAKYDAKWEAAEPETDLAIPPAADILALVVERRETAERHGDAPGVRQLDRVRMNVLSGARLKWHLGDLLLNSVNTPGLVYAVNARGCTCPNGAAGKASCWHVALFDLLLDMQEEAAATADMAAERAAAAADRATMGRRLCAARSRYLEAA